MHTEDVKKVEYYVNPTDPRFHGDVYVVNYLMQKYEWGGYTKTWANTAIKTFSVFGSVFSKFSYRKMTYDLYVDENHNNIRHGGTKDTEHFKFIDLFGHGPVETERVSETEKYHSSSNANNITFRALYNANTTMVANKLTFNHTNSPEDSNLQSMRYIGSKELLTAKTLSSGRGTRLGYGIEVYRALNEKPPSILPEAIHITTTTTLPYTRKKISASSTMPLKTNTPT